MSPMFRRPCRSHQNCLCARGWMPLNGCLSTTLYQTSSCIHWAKTATFGSTRSLSIFVVWHLGTTFGRPGKVCTRHIVRSRLLPRWIIAKSSGGDGSCLLVQVTEAWHPQVRMRSPNLQPNGARAKKQRGRGSAPLWHGLGGDHKRVPVVV